MCIRAVKSVPPCSRLTFWMFQRVTALLYLNNGWHISPSAASIESKKVTGPQSRVIITDALQPIRSGYSACVCVSCSEIRLIPQRLMNSPLFACVFNLYWWFLIFFSLMHKKKKNGPRKRIAMPHWQPHWDPPSPTADTLRFNCFCLQFQQ